MSNDDDRSKQIEKIRDLLAQDLFGRTRSQARDSNTCLSCAGPMNAEQFVDEASLRESEISHTCQKCQDDLFGTGDDD